MSYKTIMTTREDGVSVLTLNRPDKLNAIDYTMIEEASSALDDLYSDNETRVIIITGAGRGFSSGADVRSVIDKNIQGRSIWETNVGKSLKGTRSLITIVVGIMDAPVPVIAAVNGIAAGAGLSIALACDMRIASEQSRFSMAFVKMGLIPDSGGSYLLPRLIGPGRAAELALTGNIIDAQEADRIGMVNRVVPHERLMDVTRELARIIANNPPITVNAAKRAISLGMVAPNIAEHIKHESAMNFILTETEDSREAVQSFIEKREPKYTGK